MTHARGPSGLRWVPTSKRLLLAAVGIGIGAGGVVFGYWTLSESNPASRDSGEVLLWVGTGLGLVGGFWLATWMMRIDREGRTPRWIPSLGPLGATGFALTASVLLPKYAMGTFATTGTAALTGILVAANAAGIADNRDRGRRDQFGEKA